MMKNVATLLAVIACLSSLSTVTSSLLEYENPGPGYASAVEDFKSVLSIPLMLVGGYDSSDLQTLKALANPTLSESAIPAVNHRRQVQSEIAVFMLSACEGLEKRLKADQKKAAATFLAEKINLPKHVRPVIQSKHAADLKDDKKLIDKMAGYTTPSFIHHYTIGELEYVKKIFDAEREAILMLKNGEFLKAAGMESEAKALGMLSDRLLAMSGNFKNVLLRHQKTLPVFRHTDKGARPMAPKRVIMERLQHDLIGN